MPGGGAPFRLGDIGRQGWNVLRGDLPFPLAVLKESAVAHNGAWMMDFLRRAGGVRIAPHGKTTMSPQLFARQLADGAWGITVATVQQLQVCRRYGFDRVVFANPLVDRQAIRYVLDELAPPPDFEFWTLAASVEGVDVLAGRQDDCEPAALRAPARRRRLGHHRGDGAAAPGLPPLRCRSRRVRQPARRPSGDPLRPRRTRPRPGLRVLGAG